MSVSVTKYVQEIVKFRGTGKRYKNRKGNSNPKKYLKIICIEVYSSVS